MIVDAYLSVKYHGPIFGGLIGGATGFMIGFMIDYIFYKVIHKRKRVLKGKGSEVIVVINCLDVLVEKVEKGAVGTSSVGRCQSRWVILLERIYCLFKALFSNFVAFR